MVVAGLALRGKGSKHLIFGAVGEFAVSDEIETISYLFPSLPVNLQIELPSCFADSPFLEKSERSMLTPSNREEIVFFDDVRREAAIVTTHSWEDGVVRIDGGHGRTVPKVAVVADMVTVELRFGWWDKKLVHNDKNFDVLFSSFYEKRRKKLLRGRRGVSAITRDCRN